MNYLKVSFFTDRFTELRALTRARVSAACHQKRHKKPEHFDGTGGSNSKAVEPVGLWPVNYHVHRLFTEQDMGQTSASHISAYKSNF